MKRSFNHLLTATLLASQVLSISAYADNMLERLQQKVVEKIQDSRIRVGAGLSLKLEADDILQVRTGIKYNYMLDPDMGQYLRQDKWSDLIQARAGVGVVGERRLQREFAYGRFYSDWNTALRTFLFSPLDLKGLNAEKLNNLMQPGDMLNITFEKATFLGLRGHSSGTVSVTGMVGKVFVGKIIVKLLKRADGKITVKFANADENAVRLSANAKIEIIPGLLRLKFLSLDHDARLRGEADLATYTYDLNNSRSVEVLNKLLSSMDEPSILADEKFLREGVELDNTLKDGLFDVTSSDIASADVTAGVTKEQLVNMNIVAGQRTNFKFRLIPGLIEANTQKVQTMNLVNIKMSGSFVKPGQYIVGFRTNLDRSNSFGDKNRVYNMTSVVYKPDPVLHAPEQARGYRGLNDMIGISYHTEAKQTQNAKELITYAKLCNAGLIQCSGPVDLRVVAPDSPESRNAEAKSSVNTNYFFSRGLFEQIKARMNWSQMNRSSKMDIISARISPLIHEMVLDQPEVRARNMTSFFYEILENDCYSNLIGLDAQRSRSIFKRMFSEKCGTNLYDISDDLIRLNMPSLLISLFNPEILPKASQPQDRATSAEKADLAKYFTVSMNTNYETSDDVEKTINGAQFGLSLEDTRTDSAQVLEFSHLINSWQHQQNMDLDQHDRMTMIREKR